jgi:hypothetical protein
MAMGHVFILVIIRPSQQQGSFLIRAMAPMLVAQQRTMDLLVTSPHRAMLQKRASWQDHGLGRSAPS